MIRNFIYLDSQKLRSLSSQIFEGVTEQIISSSKLGSQESDEQSGPKNSGRVLADIFSKEKSDSELKFLEDHAYSLFEEKLLLEDLVNVVEKGTDALSSEKSFVKVTSRLKFNDLSASLAVLKDYNKIGESFWRVTNQSMIWNASEKMIPDNEVKKKAGEAGLQMNQKVTDAAATLIHFGFEDLLEANFEIDLKIFSAPLKRHHLRESEHLLVHKYSRVSQIDFTCLGIITQRGNLAESNATPPDVKDADGIKNAMRALADHLQVFENVFSAPAQGEFLLDPIAIYSNL